MLFILMIIMAVILFMWWKKKLNIEAPTTTFSPITTDSAAASLDETQNGKTIHLYKGDKKMIRLKGNPTTGYMWRTVKQKGHSMLIIKDWTYIPNPTSRPNTVGGSGVFELQLEAEHPGTTEFYLIYDRSFDSPTIGYSYMITFMVDGDIPAHHITIHQNKKTVRVKKNDEIFIDLPPTAPGFHWRVLQDHGVELLEKKSHSFLYRVDHSGKVLIGKFNGEKKDVKNIFEIKIQMI